MTASEPNPLKRPAVYSFSASSTTVEAVAIEQDIFSGGWIQKSIVNTANDPITGYKMRSVEQTLTVRKNLKSNPIALAAEIANKTNSTAWANGAVDTWLCSGLSAQQNSALVGQEVLEYWEVSATFAYRSSGWMLSIPNVGLNAIVQNADGTSEKRRCVTYDQDGNLQPATTPQPLNASGEQIISTSNEISRISFRLYQSVDFSTYFESP